MNTQTGKVHYRLGLLESTCQYPQFVRDGFRTARDISKNLHLQDIMFDFPRVPSGKRLHNYGKIRHF